MCHTKVVQVKKYRWSRDYESAEEELVELLAASDIDAERWTAEAGTVFSEQTNATLRQLWCAEGSLKFTINGKVISFQAGDALDIPADVRHQAIAGMAGVVCYEFPRASPNT